VENTVVDAGLNKDDHYKNNYAVCEAIDTARAESGPPLLIGTREGGLVLVKEIPAKDWEILHMLQARLAVHPVTMPLLGAAHTEVRSKLPPSAWPRPGPPVALWPPKRHLISEPPPQMLDGKKHT